MKHKRIILFFSPEQNYFEAMGGRGLGGPPGSTTAVSIIIYNIDKWNGELFIDIEYPLNQYKKLAKIDN